LARDYFGNENPLGRTITVNGVQNEIVGLVKDAKSYSVRDRPTRKAYVPFPPTGAPFSGQTTFSVRATGDAAGLIARIRQEASALDRSVPLYKMSTMTRLIDQSLAQERLIAMLASFFGGLALLLVCVGLYGVMSYTVVRRTREIGIRMALGAQPGTVRRQVLGETLWLVAAGVAIGVPAALASARLVSGLLFGLEPRDPANVATAALVMTVVALFAGYLPARKASQVDPMEALRHE
jgi:ABC-type antimicrobial peptide transport system permease subunit